jgi:hypothetical protein
VFHVRPRAGKSDRQDCPCEDMLIDNREMFLGTMLYFLMKSCFCFSSHPLVSLVFSCGCATDGQLCELVIPREHLCDHVIPIECSCVTMLFLGNIAV